MNNTTPIKILTAAVLLTFGFALTANAALINKGVTEMNHEYTVSDTLSARQQVIPLIAASMASSQMDKLLHQNLMSRCGLTSSVLACGQIILKASSFPTTKRH